MIDCEEIEAQAERLGIHTAHVERDYVFGWLLKAFYENSYLSKLLVFKGGNCMRKAYYPETRYSSDLDFSIESALDLSRVKDEINRACLRSDKAAIDTICKHLRDKVHRGALFARKADEDDWYRPPKVA
jgi:predicted nucleotidyltransferase component of viral defense system